ncbi:MAG TPA: molybdenum ABC transporter ATP-binding protein [Steroidobacteraceae bacterium]
MLKVAVVKRLASFTLRAAFEAGTPGIVALFGRSGCGKTTIINIVSGLLAPDEGRVELDGQVLQDVGRAIRVPPQRRGIGYVFQEPRLFPHLSVRANLRYGEKRAPTPRAVEFGQVIGLLGLEPLLQRRPHQLSGGERQRVALGRALLSQPRLLLLDEPLASLDASRREEVLPYLERLRDHFAIPMIYVSHQFEEVLRIATHLVLMESGNVVAQGSVNAMSLRPELRFIVGQEAVGAVVDGTVVRMDTATGLAQLQVGSETLHVSVADAPVGTRVRVQLLASDITLATEAPQGLSVRNQLHGHIIEIGADDREAALVRVDLGGPVVLARITRAATAALHLHPGRDVWVLVKALSTRGHAFRMPA